MKKYFSFLLCIFFILSLCSCNKEEISSNSTPQYSVLTEFKTTNELVEYINSQPNIKEKILSRNPNKSDSENVYVYSPSEVLTGFELYSIRLNGNNVSYEFRTGEAVNKIEAQSSTTSMSESKNSGPWEKADSYSVSSLQSSSDNNSMSAELLKMIDEYSTMYTIGWHFYEEGDVYLKNVVSQNSKQISEYTDHPGFYHSDVTYSGYNKVLGAMIHWDQDGFYFEAYIPTSMHDEFFKLVESNKFIKITGLQ